MPTFRICCVHSWELGPTKGQSYLDSAGPRAKGDRRLGRLLLRGWHSFPLNPEPTCRVDEAGGQSGGGRRREAPWRANIWRSHHGRPLSCLHHPVIDAANVEPLSAMTKPSSQGFLYLRGSSLLEALLLNWPWNEYFTCGRGGRNTIKATRPRRLRSSRLPRGSVGVQSILFGTPHGMSQSEK